jgi:hypothetical protein
VRRRAKGSKRVRSAGNALDCVSRVESSGLLWQTIRRISLQFEKYPVRFCGFFE